MQQSTETKTFIFVLFAASFCIGMHYCFTMPPWEGSDEYAHYSYAEQIAFTGKIPTRENARISGRFYRYAEHAPVRYFDDPEEEGVGEAETYKDFFAGPEKRWLKAAEFVHGTSWSKTAYTSSSFVNWQAQHPPLYYVLAAALIKLSQKATFAGHLVLIRVFSYFFAWVGLALPLYSRITKNTHTDLKNDATIGASILPFVCIAWYPVMARIGNDSLCVLLSSITLLALLDPLSARKAVLAGTALGLGALTKGYFVAIAPTIIVWLLLRAQFCKDTVCKGRLYRSSAIILVLCLLISGWWYARNIVSTGTLLGSVVEAGDVSFLHRLETVFFDKFDPLGMAKSAIGIFIGIVLPTSASLVRPATVYVLPSVLFLLMVCASWAYRYRRRSFIDTIWISPVFIAAMAAGVLYHLLLFVYLHGGWGFGTGGTYFLSVSLAVALVLGGGLRQLKSRYFSSILTGTALLYIFALSIWVFWAQMLLYAGIALPTPEKNVYSFPNGLPGVLGMPEAMHRLQFISFPKTAVLFLAGGLVCWGYGLYLYFKLQTIQAYQTSS